MNHRARCGERATDERHRAVEAAEYVSNWNEEYKRAEAQRDELAREFAEVYPNVVVQLINLFDRIKVVDNGIRSD